MDWAQGRYQIVTLRSTTPLRWPSRPRYDIVVVLERQTGWNDLFVRPRSDLRGLRCKDRRPSMRRIRLLHPLYQMLKLHGVRQDEIVLKRWGRRVSLAAITTIRALPPRC